MVVQSNNYYTFGMQTSESWTRADTQPNKYLYNAGSELNNATSNYEMFFREYDPALGRMNAVDPMASKYASLTPYNYAFNDPVFFNDPMGDDASDPSRGFNWYNYGRNSDGERVYHDASGGTSMYGSSWNYETYGGGFAKYGVGVSYGLTYEQHKQLKQNEEKSGEKVYTNNPEVIKAFMELMKAGYFIINIGNDWVALGEGLQLRDQSVLATGGMGSSMAFTFEETLFDDADRFAEGFVNAPRSPEINFTNLFGGWALVGGATNVAVRNDAGYVRSFTKLRGVANASRYVRTGGRYVAGFGFVATIYETSYDGNFSLGDGAKLTLAAVSIAFPVFGAVYGIADIAVQFYSGTSITDRIAHGLNHAFPNANKDF